MTAFEIAAAGMSAALALCILAVLWEAWADRNFEPDPELSEFYQEIEDEIAKEREHDASRR